MLIVCAHTHTLPQSPGKILGIRAGTSDTPKLMKSFLWHKENGDCLERSCELRVRLRRQHPGCMRLGLVRCGRFASGLIGAHFFCVWQESIYAEFNSFILHLLALWPFHRNCTLFVHLIDSQIKKKHTRKNHYALYVDASAFVGRLQTQTHSF